MKKSTCFTLDTEVIDKINIESKSKERTKSFIANKRLKESYEDGDH